MEQGPYARFTLLTLNVIGLMATGVSVKISTLLPEPDSIPASTCTDQEAALPWCFRPRAEWAANRTLMCASWISWSLRTPISMRSAMHRSSISATSSCSTRWSPLILQSSVKTIGHAHRVAESGPSRREWTAM